MEAQRFDTLVKTFSTPDTRRRLVRLLAALPLGLTLTTLLGDGPAATAKDDAHGRSHRRQRRARHPDDPGSASVNGAGKKQRKKKCAKVGQTTTKKRKRCCTGLAKDASGRCAAAATPAPPTPAPPTPGCSGLKPTPTSPTQGLQEAIDQAAPGATLTLCPGTWQLSATVGIAKNLTLRGAGAGQTILDGGRPPSGPGGVRVLLIEAGATVTVQDLTTTNGLADVGAGIRNFGTLTLVGVTVTGNTATDSGGGIANRPGSTLTLRNGSRVAGNTAMGATFTSGGGISNQAATLVLEAGSLVGSDTPADANSARNGGGIHNFLGGTVTLQDGSQVAGNTTTSDGGGIYNGGGTVTLQDGSRVVGNTATSAGGGIVNLGTLTVAPNAFVCNNTQTSGSQCFSLTPVTGPCPNPASGICPA